MQRQPLAPRSWVLHGVQEKRRNTSPSLTPPQPSPQSTMKMHFSIPVSQQRLDTLGGRYVLYSVYLEGFLFCKVRYSQLHRWNEQLKRVFGNNLPPFPPKYYLAMTTSMADERRDQLEQYLQNVPMDQNILRSEVFIRFFKLLQQDTFKITTKKVSLDVFLPDGRSIRIEILTSDTAERVLEIVSYKMGLSRELIGYFSLFLIQFQSDNVLSVMKKMAEFELPYVSLQSTEVENCKVGLRKWYMDPSLDSMLMDCQTAINLLYEQAVQEIEKKWAKPTEEQRQELEALRKAGNQTKFLELAQKVQHYGYMQLDSCACDYPEPGCVATLAVGNNEISCYFKLPSNQTQEVNFKMSRIKSWQVTFLGTLLEEEESPQQTLNQNLELRFQYSEGNNSWQWFTIYSKQAFLLSSCLKKMITEKMMKLAAENPEMQIEVPLEQGKRKKSYHQQSQTNSFDFPLRKGKISFKSTEEDCVFETIREEDL